MGELLIVSVVMLILLLIVIGCAASILFHLRDLLEEIISLRAEIRAIRDEKTETERHKNEIYMAIKKNIIQGAAKK